MSSNKTPFASESHSHQLIIMEEAAKLRPYYDPGSFDAGYAVIFRPGVGLINTKTGEPLNASLATTTFSNHTLGIKGFNTRSASDLDKNYVYDLEFAEYFDLNNLSQLLKNLVWNFFKNYVKVISLQPLEITRLVLQVGTFNFGKSAAKPSKFNRLLDDSADESVLLPEVSDSDEEVNYFQSSTEVNAQAVRAKSPAKSRRTARKKTKIQPISKHTIDIMTSIVNKDGPAALFRGLNAQFLHQTLSHTIEAWITGFVSPFLRIPDPFFLDLTHATEPLRSLCLSVAACVITGLILMPLDLIKVRLMITQFNRPLNDDDTDLEASTISDDSTPVSTRSVRQSILNYPLSLLVKPPPTIAFLTLLHQFSTSIFRKSAPYILFVRYNIESHSSPVLYTVTNLLLAIMEFFIKLPVENLLRKEQVRFLLKSKPLSEDPLRVVTIDNPDRDLIVDFNSGWNGSDENKGRVSTLWNKFTNLGLFNGWRVGVLNIVGFWGYEIMKSGTNLQEERL